MFNAHNNGTALLRQEALGEVPPGADHAAFTRLSVLVLEDDDLQRWAICTQLKQIGVTDIVPSHNARHALSEVMRRADGFDLAICDLHLPEVGGLEFVQQAIPLNVRKFLLVSALDMRGIVAARRQVLSFGVGVLGVLAKPVDREALRTFARMACQSSD